MLQVFRTPVFSTRIVSASAEGSSDAGASAVNQIFVMCKLWVRALLSTLTIQQLHGMISLSIKN